MAPGAICECGHTIATKKDARDEQSMQQLTNRIVKHALNSTPKDGPKTILVVGVGSAEKVQSGSHGDWKYVEKTKGDKRFENPNELV